MLKIDGAVQELLTSKSDNRMADTVESDVSFFVLVIRTCTCMKFLLFVVWSVSMW